MFGRKSKRDLEDALRKIQRLESSLSQEKETVSHLRQLLELKAQENKELIERIKSVDCKARDADYYRCELMKLEERVINFNNLKESLESRIRVLTMERDEARAMIKAKDNIPPPIEFVEPHEAPNPRRLQERTTNRKASSRQQDSGDVPDWYMPLPDS